MASSCKGVPVLPNYKSRYSVMDEDFSPSLHILDKSERELCGKDVYLLLLYRVSLAGRKKMKERKKKKNLKKIGQIGLFNKLWSDSSAKVWSGL